MTSFWDRVKTIFLAMLASGGVSYGTTQLTAPKPAPTYSLSTPTLSSPTINTVNTPFTMSKAESRRLARSWGELTQKEVDTLTADLKKAGGKKHVVVFCANDVYCGDMQLDFVNAFASAKWDFDTETPVVDNTKGIGVSDEVIAGVIRAAIPRLPVTIIQSNMKDKVALVIGKKS